MLNICADLSKRISASLSLVFAETNYLTDLSESLAQLTNALSPIIKKITTGYSYWNVEITLKKHEW
ncbi:hypothetical protein [Absicoccus porci]|uniref:hypothetical protein n=1 Tax=Absicoccus porci TaxID=2486576 RepID=UPI002942B054|nr:hypothetical protein [Absicoccus porci]